MNIEVTADYLTGVYLYLYTGSPGYHGCIWIHVEVIIYIIVVQLVCTPFSRGIDITL